MLQCLCVRLRHLAQSQVAAVDGFVRVGGYLYLRHFLHLGLLRTPSLEQEKGVALISLEGVTLVALVDQLPSTQQSAHG